MNKNLKWSYSVINLSCLKWQLLKSFIMLMRSRMVSNTHQSTGNTWQTTFTSRSRETKNTGRTEKTLRTWGARGSLDKRKITVDYYW